MFKRQQKIMSQSTIVIFLCVEYHKGPGLTMKFVVIHFKSFNFSPNVTNRQWQRPMKIVEADLKSSKLRILRNARWQ